MKRSLKRRKEEPLYAWCNRLADYYRDNDVDAKTFHEIVFEVSKESYIHGCHDMQPVIYKCQSQ